MSFYMKFYKKIGTIYIFHMEDKIKTNILIKFNMKFKNKIIGLRYFKISIKNIKFKKHIRNNLFI